jgi:uncharacterized protein (DUF1778 family)
MSGLLSVSLPPEIIKPTRIISSELATDTGKQDGGRKAQISKKMNANTLERIRMRKEKKEILEANTANKKTRAKFDAQKLKQIIADADEIISEEKIVTIKRKRYRKELAELHQISVGMLDKLLRQSTAKHSCGACAESFCVRSMAITHDWQVKRCDICSERRRVTTVENFGGVI